MYVIPVYRFDRYEKRSRTRQILGTTAALAGTGAAGYAAFKNRSALKSAAQRGLGRTRAFLGQKALPAKAGMGGPSRRANVRSRRPFRREIRARMAA